jgi:glycogen debranching enzyme
MFKSIDNIHVNGKITKITNKFSSIIRERDNKSTEEFTWPFEHNSFIYEIKKYNGNIVLDLDCRGSSDNDEWGRFYNISLSKNQIIITYEKQNDYWVYVVITGKNIKAEKVREWKRVPCEIDIERGEEPAKHIYTALKINISGDAKLVFSAGTEREKVIRESDYVFRNINKLKRKQENAMLYKNTIKNKEKRMACNAALNSLNGLLVDVNGKLGIFAGFPWFFQFWTRDEMVSIKALGKRKEASDIFGRTLRNIEKDGRLPNRNPSTQEGGADGIGWFYKRYAKKDELNNVIDALHKNHTKDGFLIAKKRETWMDSFNREGACIELQALMLNMYKLSGRKKLEAELKKKVKVSFWNKKYLNDGLEDPTIRSNVLLAYYIYPDLLTKEEWLKCITFILPKLWCNWGGISTLDKRDKDFKPLNTGINHKSYHRGDSFIYVNNITAIILNDLDKKTYKNKISKIVEASTNEILWEGILGHHSEISSAKKLESKGCKCQAWSAATYIEMMNSI